MAFYLAVFDLAVLWSELCNEATFQQAGTGQDAKNKSFLPYVPLVWYLVTMRKLSNRENWYCVVGPSCDKSDQVDH